jgi:UTP--glucose-1-phosphate uridylyltransferase
VMLPDVIMEAVPSCLAQLIAVHEARGGNVIGVEAVPESETHKYGVIAPKDREGRLMAMTGMVEKPPQGTAPSNLSIAGRYVLQPEIFEALAAHETGAGGEIQLTDAMARLMGGQPFWAYEYEGETYDCGDKVGLLRANVALALKRADLGEAARTAVEGVLGR